MVHEALTLPESPAVPHFRYDIYSEIHKALRAIMGDTLAKVGRLDSQDAQEVATVLQQTSDLLRMCRSHLEHENQFIHPALEARRPASSHATADDHVGHDLALRNLWLDLEAVSSTTAEDRDLAVKRLYRDLSVFVAENLQHMDREERENNSVLWAGYSDEELAGIEKALVASLQPDEMSLTISWMIPALTPRERARKLAGIRAGVPAPVFQHVLALSRPGLSEAGWNKLQRDLDLPASA